LFQVNTILHIVLRHLIDKTLFLITPVIFCNFDELLMLTL